MFQTPDFHGFGPGPVFASVRGRSGCRYTLKNAKSPNANTGLIDARFAGNGFLRGHSASIRRRESH